MPAVTLPKVKAVRISLLCSSEVTAPQALGPVTTTKSTTEPAAPQKHGKHHTAFSRASTAAVISPCGATQSASVLASTSPYTLTAVPTPPLSHLHLSPRFSFIFCNRSQRLYSKFSPSLCRALTSYFHL